MPIPSKLQHCTVFFGTAPDRNASLPQEGSSYAGTGFIVSMQAFGESSPYRHNYLVTNAHVAKQVQSLPTAFVRLNLIGGGSECVWLDGQQWVTHPRKSVDIAILRPAFHTFPAWSRLAVDAISPEEFLPADMPDNVRLGVGDTIHVPGLLRIAPGLTSNMPLVRSGTLAALAAEPLKIAKDVYEPVHLGIILSVGGMSGSPTFIQCQPHAVASLKAWGYLLGVNAGHFEDESDRAAADSVNAGVNIIHPVAGLREILNLPEVAQERKDYEDVISRLEAESS